MILSRIEKGSVSPDTEDSVKYLNDQVCAYVIQGYRAESHHFDHALTGLLVCVSSLDRAQGI